MALLNPLERLIDAGADAQANLFVIELVPQLEAIDKNLFVNYTSRLENFTVPAQAISTTSLLFQNIKIDKPIVSSDFQKVFTITFRLDKNYELYDALRKTLAVNEFGNYKLSRDKAWTARVKLYTGELEEASKSYVKAWTFNQCFLTRINQLTYDYSSAAPLKVTADFVFDYYVPE